MYSLNLILKVGTESNNKLLRKNYHARALANRDIYDLIFLKTRTVKPERPLTNFKLKLVRHSNCALDYDNLVSSFKAFVDGLTRAGVIADDKWVYSGKWDVSQEYRPKKEGPLVEIVVEESREIRTWRS